MPATCLVLKAPALAQVVEGEPFVVVEPPAGVESFDLDAWLAGRTPGTHSVGSWPDGCGICLPRGSGPWFWQMAPTGILYKSYLASVREPRLGTVLARDLGQGALWESTLGARIGLLRFGTAGDGWANGFQIDAEGAALLRLDSNRDLKSTDFRGGIPLTYQEGRYSTKLAYYHLSSHLGDEFLLRTGAQRINYVRDVLVWGHSWQGTDWLRVYFELGYAFYTEDGSQPWELQFGIELSQLQPTGNCGAPFLACNAHLREEVDFGGNFVARAGWQWRRQYRGPLLRIGAHYYNGKSSQYQFFDRFEQQLGVGAWYDF
ncbi:MAG: DUF1207 domain-containing protein [Planctomycetales bacterium]|nr:DUF1207 domain-containing protein [Planctomycetales bacterium]NIN07454.1 DUF1207 domain-containing protein [Planctomycetales bacterium]NIN76560.1 DUF1207 domain-containing protein [Planctomycetales bacterium]NIO33748.1 DUF1207 domain-containing protein [Planctomycetales bacterium]NIO45570.1 DUF1207 domain-containing protein [Planctomycetales bacterium]